MRKPPPPLRPYQWASLSQVREHLGENPVLVLPTGAGKTFTASVLVQQLGVSTLWLAHRTELIVQARDQLAGLGLNVGTIKAGMDSEPTGSGPKVWVASVQTMFNREIPEDIGLLVFDECHHAAASQYKDVITRTDCPRIGLTATPFRLDGTGLDDVFGHLVVGCYADDLCEAGILIDPTVYIGEPPDLTGVKVVGGDYVKVQVEQRMQKLTGDIVGQWMSKCRGEKTVCYAAGVEHSKKIVDAFRAAGVPAAHLDGSVSHEERAGILADLERGDLQIVSNCMVLTEGWDMPQLRCLIDAAPTKSLCLHLQKIGRVMRSAPGKDGCTVLDHAGNHHRHGRATRRINYSLSGKGFAGGGLGLVRCPHCMLLVNFGTQVCPGCGALLTTEGGGPDRDLLVHNPGDLTLFRDDVEARQRRWLEILEVAAKNRFDAVWAMNAYNEQYGNWPASTVDLRIVDHRKASMSDKLGVMRFLARAAKHRGYEFGWCSHKYKDIFGCWPKGFVEDARIEYWKHRAV